MLKTKISCPHPSQTWTMFPSIYRRPLWPYGRLRLALDRTTSPPPLERYVRQRGDGWNILEKRRCVEGKITCPHTSQPQHQQRCKSRTVIATKSTVVVPMRVSTTTNCGHAAEPRLRFRQNSRTVVLRQLHEQWSCLKSTNGGPDFKVRV